MSKWGNEELETKEKIKELYGKVLNIAAGDGRFNNEILKVADEVTAIDNNENDLKLLQENTDKNFNNKLIIKKINILNTFPFENESFDCVFCTGTLHLFQKNQIKYILSEIDRVLKRNGRILFDFATDIQRLDKNSKFVEIKGEGNYTKEEANNLFIEYLKKYNINIEIHSFKEENLDDAGYNYIEGNFLIISGIKEVAKNEY